MSYAPKGASLPARFKKATTNSGFKQRPKDRLVTVDAYDLPNKSISATEVDTGRKIEARINPDKAPAGNRNLSDKWNGNLIDERMESNIPVGSRIVLEACETEKKVQKGGVEVSLMRCNWVASPSDPSPEKSFTGTLTVNQYEDRIVGVQVWDAKAINPSEDERAIDELGAKLDEVVREFKEGLRPVGYGVQFRTLVEVKRNNMDVYEMVDSSPPFDWIRAEKDAEGKVLREGHPLDKEHLEAYLGGYLDYVYGSEDQSDPDAPKGLVADGVVGEGQNMQVEVMVYRAFQAAPLSENMAIKNERHPLARLANVMIKYGQNDETGYIGKNWGVAGIAFLTSDQQPKKRGEEWKPRNLVNRVFTNGFSGNVHTMVQAFDGKRVYPHPALDRVREAGVAPEANASYGSTTAARQSAPVSSAPVQLSAPETDPSTLFDEDDENANYFATATQAPVVEEAPVVPEIEGADADADDATLDAVAEEKKDDKKTGRDRFARRGSSV